MNRSAFLLLPLLLGLHACNPESKACKCAGTDAPIATASPQELRASVVRVNATLQQWNPWQPWEKNPPSQRSALAAIVGDQEVLTTAEMAAYATYLEFESADGTRFIPAKVIARDDEANLALLGPGNAEQGKEFFADTRPLSIDDAPEIGESLDILQLEANGLALLTSGTLQSVDLAGNFLTYLVKASMQSAASSFSLPVLHKDKLAGVLIGYNSDDQICDVVSTEIVSRFLNEARKQDYVGFPSLGVTIAVTEDPSFRQWLKLKEDQGGIYIHKVRKGAAADLAGIRSGDVILAADGHPIDRRGYYQHPRYGSLLWAHLVRGEKSVSDPLVLSVLRNGEPLEITAKLTREEESDKLVPVVLVDQAPSYLVKGGLIFQELTGSYLHAFGKDWSSRAPLNLLAAFENPDEYQDRMRRVVFLSAVIPTPATVGYERLRSLIVSKVNGKDIRDMQSLIDAFRSKSNGLHSIEFVDEHLVVYLDDSVSDMVDGELLKRGLSKLSHVEQD